MACEIKVVTENDLGNGLEIVNQKVVVKLGDNLSFAPDGSIDVELPATTVTNSVVGTNLTTTVNGVEGSVDLTNAVKAAETTTVLSDVLSEGNKIGTYTNEDGTGVEIKETITSLAVSGAVLNFKDENGVINPVDITNAVKTAETVTTLSGALATGNKIGSYTNEDGVVVDINETITSIASFSFNAGTSEITLTYTKEDGTPDTKSVNLSTLKLDSIASITVSPDGTKLVITNTTGSTDEVLLTDIFDAINHTLSSTANVMTSVVGNITETADIINSLAIAIVSGTKIKLTINGVDSASFDLSSVIKLGETLTSLTSTVVSGGIVKLDYKDEDGTVNSIYLPNEVFSFDTETFPTEGDLNKLYINTETNVLSYWNGVEFVQFGGGVEVDTLQTVCDRGNETTTEVKIYNSLLVGDDANDISGEHSFAQGTGATASGNNSFAQGLNVTAAGDFSHAQGFNTNANGEISHAEGNSSIADGEASHAEGEATKATGSFSHAEGFVTESIGARSHAEGVSAKSIGEGSHAEGFQTYAIGKYSHSEGEGSMSEVTQDTLSQTYVQTSNLGGDLFEFFSVTFINLSSFKVSGDVNFAEHLLRRVGDFDFGVSSPFQVLDFTFDGTDTTVTLIEPLEASYTFFSGGGQATGIGSHSEGLNCNAIGNHSHAEGVSSYASGDYSHAEGQASFANGISSHAEGGGIANGESSHAEGGGIANGQGSHAEGGGIANGQGSHAEGNSTIADGNGQHVQGQFNQPNTNPGEFQHGNGTDPLNRHNLFRLGGAGVVRDDTMYLDGKMDLLEQPFTPANTTTPAGYYNVTLNIGGVATQVGLPYYI
jgi:hypothetical protein